MASKTTFVINGKRYNALEFDFNLICDLEDLGVSMERIKQNPASAIRAYLALCMDAEKADAGAEIQAHIVKGGTLDELTSAMTVMLENSDFFRSLSQGEEEETPASKTKKK